MPELPLMGVPLGVLLDDLLPPFGEIGILKENEMRSSDASIKR